MTQPLRRPEPELSPAGEISLQARWAVDRDAPLLILVIYRREADKQAFLTELARALTDRGLAAREMAPAFGEPDRARLYDQLAAAPARTLSLVTRLLPEPAGLELDTDFLEYLNLHRDRISRDRLRFVLFLHEADAEQFQREAGDLWDFRHHTFWLDGEPASRADVPWLRLQRVFDTAPERAISETRERIEKHCRRVREQVARTPDAEERAALLGDLASWLLRRDAFKPASVVAMEALRELGDEASHRRAELEGVLAEALQRTGQRTAAREHLERQVDLYESLGELNSVTEARLRLADLYLAGDQLLEAEDILREELVRVRAEEAEARGWLGQVYAALGEVAMRKGSFNNARKWFLKALEVFEEQGNRLGMAKAASALGSWSLVQGGDPGQAEEWLREALAGFKEAGDQRGMAQVFVSLGVLESDQGSFFEGTLYFLTAYRIFEGLGDRMSMANAYSLMGRFAALPHGRFDKARDWLGKAAEIYETLGHRTGLASALSHLGFAVTQEGHPEEGVPLNLRSLFLRLEMEAQEVQDDLRWLEIQREQLGEECFQAILAGELDEERRKAVLELLAEHEKADQANAEQYLEEQEQYPDEREL